MSKTTEIYRFNLRNLKANPTNEFSLGKCYIRLFHNDDGPDSSNRVIMSNGGVSVELLPSKGLSLGQAWINKIPMFWDAPTKMPDTEDIDLWSDEIRINGEKASGFTFLKTLMAGVELYGLQNWGMPVEVDGKLYPIHGETSNIPVDEIIFGGNSDKSCWVEASFIYRSFGADISLPWYKRGKPLYKVTKRVIIEYENTSVIVEDTIKNISENPLTPDWGYHITFRPEDGAKYLVPSRMVQERGDKKVTPEFETWHKAKNEKKRCETGIIHKKLKQTENNHGEKEIKSALIYPDLTGIVATTPPSPYFQTWFCCGGKGSNEFTNSEGNSILLKNWDGMGIEIGSSALDHDGNAETLDDYKPVLKVGEQLSLKLKFQLLSGNELNECLNDINYYNKDRKL